MGGALRLPVIPAGSGQGLPGSTAAFAAHRGFGAFVRVPHCPIAWPSPRRIISRTRWGRSVHGHPPPAPVPCSVAVDRQLQRPWAQPPRHCERALTSPWRRCHAPRDLEGPLGDPPPPRAVRRWPPPQCGGSRTPVAASGRSEIGHREQVWAPPLGTPPPPRECRPHRGASASRSARPTGPPRVPLRVLRLASSRGLNSPPFVASLPALGHWGVLPSRASGALGSAEPTETVARALREVRRWGVWCPMCVRVGPNHWSTAAAMGAMSCVSSFRRPVPQAPAL